MPPIRRPAFFLSLLAASAFVAPAPVAAEALAARPGKWRTRTEMTSTMSPQPRVVEETRCVEDGEWDPDALTKDAGPGCRFHDVRSSASRLQWKVRCDVQGGSMTGEADYRVSGDRVDGTMTMDMDAGPMQLGMNLAFEGERIGDCD